MKKFRKKLVSSKGAFFTQQACAGKMKVNQQDWNRWESGKILPSPANQRKIAEILNVSLAELRGENNAPTVMVGASSEEVEIIEAYVAALTKLSGFVPMVKRQQHREVVEVVIEALGAIAEQLEEEAGEEDTIQDVG